MLMRENMPFDRKRSDMDSKNSAGIEEPSITKFGFLMTDDSPPALMRVLKDVPDDVYRRSMYGAIGDIRSDRPFASPDISVSRKCISSGMKRTFGSIASASSMPAPLANVSATQAFGNASSMMRLFIITGKFFPVPDFARDTT